MLACAQFLLGTGTAFVSGSDNAFLYDTLVADGRADDIAEEELISWRYQYSGLAVSAAIGGFIGYYDMPMAFLLSALAGVAGMLVMLMAKEPPTSGKAEVGRPLQQLGMVFAKMRTPMLFWLFVHAVTGYILSHVPFVFAQPYLRETLSQNGLSAETPLIAGLIVSAMMVASVLAGKMAPSVNRMIGNAGSFLLSKAIQIALIVAMALLLHPGVIPLLLIRMVPDALSKPYVLALTQPRLESAYRASYLSVQRPAVAAGLFCCAIRSCLRGIGRIDPDRVRSFGHPSVVCGGGDCDLGLAGSKAGRIGRLGHNALCVQQMIRQNAEANPGIRGLNQGNGRNQQKSARTHS